MTVLQRTDLTTSQKIQCAAAAVAGQHAHGSKTALSERYEISRPTVYAVGAAAESVLRSHFEAPLLQGAAVDVRVDDAQLRRAVPLAAERARLVVALRVLAPNAIRPIEDLVPLLYPGVKVSYGTIQQMLVEAEGRAARFNAQVSLGGGLPVTGKGSQTGRVLLRRSGTVPPLPWSTFAPPLTQGGVGAKKRREALAALAAIPDGEELLVLATGRYIGEGFDEARLDTLFLTMPVSWRGTVVQYTGRLHRLHPGKTEARIYDYVDRRVPVLARMYERRMTGYRTIGYERVDEAVL